MLHVDEPSSMLAYAFCPEINFEAIVKNSYGVPLKFEPSCINFQLQL